EGQSPVTLKLEDVPLEAAVKLMADVAGLRPVRIGNVLYVTNKANAADLRADPDGTPPTPINRALEDIAISAGAAMPPRGVPVPIAPPPPGVAPAPPVEKPKDDKPAEKPGK